MISSYTIIPRKKFDFANSKVWGWNTVGGERKTNVFHGHFVILIGGSLYVKMNVFGKLEFFFLSHMIGKSSELFISFWQ